ncbi:MAG: excinuclease ABC subunit B [Candidatus Taylorbacteria bacterium RIFCSPHIGHO2_02_49_25]|uniref:UvrABC system protein B n=1 Tax=Candidatus Taylorbacteria bacterium RIFCSPHIGHO2_02_49_25 TaxID=1802305 RepID=A0A1G2MGP8_9BACT|nr:MAG: UvrABC system protein B [Parcubacteria group bacterium GW2011_GWF2_50_9]OHA19846.1 MAG: excinuclease ABC subunit B [Candidatus Taylorbacteria bacterium RIFCSPHIGHO2_01_FULL_49_60]OHA22884.1 MAG: excinuclease ABC subunit B [Candidatus Taylorbacteria bacterium RIFCSPHIGHO2_02_49_25]OHA36301.1 MAG: excinuclease ABC subunit B [Candidatus Taylorbacteria bacterium RIFCSPLOWO2_02_50_13]OHA41000.1 MAG: excinuclease ABC subunit B [Candidatus Taylorbacteria bacterium RIFCSPLOWO2_02_FULL_50_120]O
MAQKFKLKSRFKPAGDQPTAIEALVKGIENGARYQTLLGVTGSGKTFTVANVIEKIQKPTLVIAHNKTLAAQLAQEYRGFFPDNEVHYFVSYYDFYQPEAYMPITDTYIEKEAQINEEIERLRHASTQALLSRKDVIIVASVSCIYGLGSPEEYEKVNRKVTKGMALSRGELVRALVGIHYTRTTADLSPGMFRALGDVVEVQPQSERAVHRIEFTDGVVRRIQKVDPISRTLLKEEDRVFIFPARHFITPKDEREKAIQTIQLELRERLKEFEQSGKLLEAERLKRRTRYDLAMIKEVGYCNGIENYSRHFSGKLPGEPPDTLLSYFEKGRRFSEIKTQIDADGIRVNQRFHPREPAFLTIIDESHVTLPQLRGMYAGDRARKEALIEHGFRLPSAKDNRPLTFEEFETRVGRVLFTSATPGPYELEKSAASRLLGKGVVEQVIRPTGLVDPNVEIRPVRDSGKYRGQIQDFISEAKKDVAAGGRAIATTLTKKMAENLTEFLKERGIKAEYLHSDIETLDRITILSDFRKGVSDILVGVNLLREGLDLPEVSLIGILDADKEGFLRSETSLIQIIGRAARNVAGRVILYADSLTGSMERALRITNRRRALQLAYNKRHGITPRTIVKKVLDITETLGLEREKAVSRLVELDRGVLKHKTLEQVVAEKRKQMSAAVKILDFETASLLRDEIAALGKVCQPKGTRTKR